jgi:ribosomal protein L4
MYDISLPKKIRLLGLKTLLSARFSEGKIIFVDKDALPERKTKHVANALNNFSEKDTYLVVSGVEKSEDFVIASENIERVKYVSITVPYFEVGTECPGHPEDGQDDHHVGRTH